jgi:nitrogen fixation/metabolism regulation signal transduction histidine kinase
MSFLGDEYGRPKLTESKIIKKIINNQTMEISKEQKIFNYILQIIINNYQIIIIFILIILGLYWRYTETKTKKKQQHQLNNYLSNDYDSEFI